MKLLFYTLTWLVTLLLAGAMGNYPFKVDFLAASLVAGLALIANGLIQSGKTIDAISAIPDLASRRVQDDPSGNQTSLALLEGLSFGAP